MKKQILFLGLSILLLVSCGSEVTEVKKKADYNYVELDECTVPIPKNYKTLKGSKVCPHRFSEYSDVMEMYRIFLCGREEDDIEKIDEVVDKFDAMTFISKTKRDNFTIIETSFKTVTGDSQIYYLFSEKSHINLENSNEVELTYLLDYCRKTWKSTLKREKHAK